MMKQNSQMTDNLTLHYDGKELDRTFGLDWYDYGARNYDAAISRWDRMDPLCEKYYHVSPYVYCVDNPIRMKDANGEKPGDYFETIDEAAIDFGLTYNDNSIIDNKEYASCIFAVMRSGGRVAYTYTVPNIGEEDHSSPSSPLFGTKKVAIVHTHASSTSDPGDNLFSGSFKDEEILTKSQLSEEYGESDIGLANKKGIPIFVATPNGSLKKYDVSTHSISLISTQMPSDEKDPERLNKKKFDKR